MSKLSKRDSILLLVIGLVAVLGGMYWFYVKPAKADLTTAKQTVQTSEDQVSQLQAQLTQLTAQTQEPKNPVPVADELRLAKAYPYSEDIPALILQLEELAKQTHVELGEATPSAGTDYAGVTGTPFQISVKGKFFDVQDFLYRLHNRVRVDNGRLRVKGRLLAVTKADLSPEAEGDSASGGSNAQSKVAANITVVAFSRTAAAAAAPAAAAQPTAAPAANTTGGTN